MFSRIVVAALVALPALVSAAPGRPGSSGGQCNVGELHCCNTQHSPGSAVATAAGLLGIPLNLGELLGFNCNPISVLGASGNNCAAQPVCCEQNQFTALVNALDCAPINVNL